MPKDAVDEQELKLELTPDDADALDASGLFSGRATVVRQESIYFDTPGHDLFRAGLSLRIRRSGKRRVQTVKADRSAAGILVRAEWEQEVAGSHPVIGDETPVATLLGNRAALLAPVFVVENERRIWNRSGVEIALDRGRIVAGERECRFCEVELERKDGSLADVFALARKVDAALPARIGILSKAERGYRLLGPAAQASKAERVELHTDMTVADSFRAIAGSCLRHFHRNVPAILNHDDTAALHQARVAIRRLRSALTIFRPALANGAASAFNRELRWLAGKLASAREIDVLVHHAPDPALLEGLVAARAKAYATACTSLRSKRCRKLMLDLAEWIAIGGWLSAKDNAELREQPLGQFARQTLEHRRKVLKKRGHNLAQLDDAARHEARKAAKTMRYATDFFAALYAGKRALPHRDRFIAALEDLQDNLGNLNDIATAPHVLARIGLGDASTATQIVSPRRKARMLEAATGAQHAFLNEKAYWR